jgi:hypothetical protein
MAPHELEALRARLADDVVFHSPVADYRGRDVVGHLLTLIEGVLGEVRTTEVLRDGPRVVRLFAASVEGRPADGVLSERLRPDGLVAEAALFLRPLRALQAAVEQMGRALAAGPPRSG